MRSLALSVVSCVVLTTQTASALIEVQFQDGVPWDVFMITSTGCPIADSALVIDLRTSAAGVLVDTTYGGPGSQDPLPAELAAGNAVLAPVADGAQELVVAIALLDVATPIRLQMDVDDTAPLSLGSRIAVAEEEITGATATLTYEGASSTGTFDTNGIATIPAPDTLPDCLFIG